MTGLSPDRGSMLLAGCSAAECLTTIGRERHDLRRGLRPIPRNGRATADGGALTSNDPMHPAVAVRDSSVLDV